jgi:UDP-N-acetylmuramyl pentapeptide phosphotransferase/UDP-N-acetylglucosamine-1-phosphate transferase
MTPTMPFSFLTVMLICLTGFVVSAVSLHFLIPYLTKKAFLDIPNERSSHKKVTPRGGGIAVLLGFFVASTVAKTLEISLPDYTFFVGLLLVSSTSLLDDRFGLPVWTRLSVHLVVMGMMIYQTGGIKTMPFPAPFNFELGYWGYLVSGIWIVAVVNFFNFLDGIDGFAGTQSLLAGIALSVISWGQPQAVVGLCIAAASLGFLLYNWHPAKIFMGDVGSISLGYAFATLPFYAGGGLRVEELVYSTAIFLWFFLADGAFTLIRRALKGEKVWQAHRTHLYQRLNQTGWYHHFVVLFVMLLAAVLAAVQCYMVIHGCVMNWSVGLCGLVLFLVYLVLVAIREKQMRP